MGQNYFSKMSGSARVLLNNRLSTIYTMGKKVQAYVWVFPNGFEDWLAIPWRALAPRLRAGA